MSPEGYLNSIDYKNNKISILTVVCTIKKYLTKKFFLYQIKALSL